MNFQTKKLRNRLKEDYDTVLTKTVITWLASLLRQGRGVDMHTLAMVCRFDNWRSKNEDNVID